MRDYVDEIQDFDGDAVVSTARKAACLLDAARLAKVWTPGARHVSDRVLEYPTSWLAGKRIAVVDDVVGTGKTLDSVLLRCEAAGASEIKVYHIAQKSNWPHTIDILRRRHPAVDFSSRPLVDDAPELVREAVSAIASIPRPYNIDWPLFAGWRVSTDELDWLVSDPDWTIRRVRSLRPSGTPSMITLEAGQAVRRALSQGTGLRLDLLALAKIRLYLERFDDDTLGLCLLGLCSLNALDSDSLEWCSERFHAPSRSPYAVARVAQYEASLALANYFAERGRQHLGQGSLAESSWQRSLCFGPSVQVATPRINHSLVPLRARDTPADAVSADETRLVRSGLISAMQDASLNSPYRLDRGGARLDADRQASFLDNTPSRESFSYAELVGIAIRELPGLSQAGARALTSSFLDDAIDTGATVPGFRLGTDGTLERIFRAGETIRFSEREQSLLIAMLTELLYDGELQDLDAPKNKVGRTFLEKCLVLAVRYATERTGFVEILDRASDGVPTLTISYSRHGAILDARREAFDRPIANEHTVTFGTFLARRRVLNWKGDSRARFAALATNGPLLRDENVATFQQLGMALAEVHKRKLMKNAEIQALATLCNQRQHPLALWAEIDRTRNFLERVATGLLTGDLDRQVFDKGVHAEGDVGISIQAAFAKVHAIAHDTAAATRRKVAEGLDRRDRLVWEDVMTRIFIPSTPQSEILTQRAQTWVLNLCAAIDELRIEFRSTIHQLPQAGDVSDLAEVLGCRPELDEFRSKFGQRRTGVERLSTAFDKLVADGASIAAEARLYYDTDCLLVEPRRYYDMLVIRSEDRECALCDELRQQAIWRFLIPLPVPAMPPGLLAFAILDGRADDVSNALAKLMLDRYAQGSAVIVKSLADDERVLHRPMSDAWITSGLISKVQPLFSGGMEGARLMTLDGDAERSGRAHLMPIVAGDGSRRELVEVLIVCAAMQEWDIIQKEVFGALPSVRRGITNRHCLAATIEVLERSISVAAICPSDQGGEEMLTLVSDAFSLYQPDVVCLVGIAGGLSTDLGIGDVLVASSVLRYERGKESNGVVYRELKPSTLPVSAVNDLTGLAANLRNARAWPYKVEMGSYGAGEKVVADELGPIAKWLRDVDRKIGAVEMESGAFFKGLLSYSSALSSGCFWFVCKGISDRADANSMGGPANPAERADWERARLDNQVLATRRSIETALALAVSYLQQEESH